MAPILDIAVLRAQLAARNASVVAIDGRGGSGKSTLARRLADGWPNALVIEMDDFYRPVAEQVARSEAHGAGYDRERLATQVLEPLAKGRDGAYERYDWDHDRLAERHRVPADAVVLLEGVYSSSRPLRRYLDFTIWVDCPYDLRLERGLARDGESMRRVWVVEWMPAEDRYAEAERPHTRADLVLDGSGCSSEGAAFEVLAQPFRGPANPRSRSPRG